jgi:hypothetical protein
MRLALRSSRAFEDKRLFIEQKSDFGQGNNLPDTQVDGREGPYVGGDTR